MRLIFILGVIGVVSFATYLFVDYMKNLKKINWSALKVAIFVGLVLLTFFVVVITTARKNQSDEWCGKEHATTSYPPAETKTAMNWFEKGNYEYDKGNCTEAIKDYTKSISLNSKYPEAFNNRAYAYMRSGDFKSALEDLNKALTLNPNYVNALSNRGDVYSHEMQYAKAVIDYKKVIELSPEKRKDICGDLTSARYEAEHSFPYLMTLPEVIKCNRNK